MPTKTPTAEAYVNWGRWVVDCPHEDCNGGILAPEDTDLVVCPDCGNEVKVKHPHQNTRKAALKVLAYRPLAENRNWDPRKGEGVDDLKAENVLRGERIV